MAAADAATDSLLDIPANISPLSLPNGRSLTEKVLQKGLNYYTQGYVHSIKIKETDTAINIDARCWHSMRKSRCWHSMRKSDEPHHLHLDIQRATESISESFCSCKVSLSGHCSHIVGLLKCLQGFKLHNFSCIPDEQSCTSVPQQWHIPTGAKIQPVPLSQVVVAKAKEQRKRKPVICEVNENYRLPEVTSRDKLKLSALHGTPLQHLMFNNAPTVTTEIFGPLPLGSILSYQTSNLKKPLVQISTNGCGDTTVTRPSPVKLPTEFSRSIPQQEIENIEKKTREQSNARLWHDVRKDRLTASNFGKILKRKAQPTPSFLNTIFNRTCVNAAPLEYGRRNEISTKRKYLKKFPSAHFHECGFVINHEFSFLGASPDGKLCCDGESGIVEIKCPFTARNMKVSDACDEVRGFCLQRCNGKMSLKRDHEYYAQIQGQLMITGCDFCEFIIYTHCDLFVESILPDNQFMTDMLYRLSTFYKNHAQHL